MSGKENILVISYKFPPVAGAGVYRVSRLCRHMLNGTKYNPIVLTIPLDEAEIRGFHLDSGTAMPQVEVHHFHSSEPIKLRNKLMKWHLFRPVWYLFFNWFWDEGARWPYSAFDETVKLIREKNIRLVFTTSPTFATLLFGYRLRKKLGIKWIADLRDPYTQGYGRTWPSKLHWYWSRRSERKFLKTADRVIVVTPEMQQMYIRQKLVDSKRITVVTNGI